MRFIRKNKRKLEVIIDPAEVIIDLDHGVDGGEVLGPPVHALLVLLLPRLPRPALLLGAQRPVRALKGLRSLVL